MKVKFLMNNLIKALTLVFILLPYTNWAQDNIQGPIQAIDQAIANQEFDLAVNLLDDFENSVADLIEGNPQIQLLLSSRKATAYSGIQKCEQAILEIDKANKVAEALLKGQPETLVFLKSNLARAALDCDQLSLAKNYLEFIYGSFTDLESADPDLVVGTLYDLGYVYSQEDPEQAIALYNKLISYYDQYLENDDLYFSATESLSTLYFNTGQNEKAVEYYAKLKLVEREPDLQKQFFWDFLQATIQNKTLVPAIEVNTDLIRYCDQSNACLPNLKELGTFYLTRARLNLALNKYEAAQQDYQKAETFLDKEKDYYTLAEILLEHSEAAENLHQYAIEETLLEEAKNILEANDDKENAIYPVIIFNTAAKLAEIGQIGKASEMYEDFITYLSMKDQQDPQLLSKAYQNAGNAYFTLQDLERATLYYNKARKMLEANDLYQTPEYISLLNSIGASHQALSNFKAAEKEFSDAYVLASELEGYFDLKVAVASNLADLWSNAIGESDSAEILLNQAIKWQIAHKGKVHPTFAQLLGKRGLYYQNTGKLDLAKKDFLQAYKVLDYAGYSGKSEQLVMQSNLGYNSYLAGAYNKAIQELVQAIEGFEKVYPESNPSYQLALNNLANAYIAANRMEEAKPIFIRLANLQLERIQSAFSYLSEKDKSIFVADQKKFLNSFKRYILKGYETNKVADQDLINSWFNLELQTKGMLLSGQRREREAIFNSGDENLIALFSQWSSLRREIAALSSIKTKSDDNITDKIADMEKQVADLEVQMARSSSSFKKNFSSEAATWQKLQEKLSEDQVALELINIALDSSNWYVALGVSGKPGSQPELLVLGEGADFDKKFFNFYTASIEYSLQDKKTYNIYWKPFEPFLDKYQVKTIYFSPDGVFHKLNPATLFNPETEKYLLEEYDIVQVTGVKSLLNDAGRLNSESSFKEILLVGRPDYSLGGKGVTQKVQENAERSLTSLAAVDLPGTEAEVKAIDEMLSKSGVQTQMLLDTSAHETAIKNRINKDVVHIATHGFFIDAKTSKVSANDDPMLHSGLLLAGASGNDERGEDGILTAYEVMNLDLSQNELVVLSACQTGLGETSDGEGVYGLQRAFFIAGTKHLIMSLWNVDDAATRDLMTSFYENYLETKEVKTAFQLAQKSLIEKYTEPRFWGAFVLVEG
jgi:CHAT domain-containing protein